MSVVAKFYVQKVTPTPEGSSTAQQVILGAVTRGVENGLWSQYTPTGSITMGVLNEAATAQFLPGEEYLVTFTHVAKPAAGDGHPTKQVEDKHGSILCETCGTHPGWPDGYKVGDPDWTRHDEMYALAE